LARAADEVLADPQRLAAARERAHRLGQERFNWEQEQHALLQCVETALTNSRTAPSRQYGG
jgi:hypothetical protein